MYNEIELTCIGCPMGCSVSVKKDGDEIKEITGYTCKRGLEYAKTEVTNPVRTVTSTVRVFGGKTATVAVKTAEPVPKSSIFDCMEAIHAVELEAPVEIGDVILKNIAGTGIDLVASSNAGAEDD